MTLQVAVAKAKGDGGIQDPNTGSYISSKRDTIIAYTPWVENLANHGEIEARVVENSNYNDYVRELASDDHGGDQEKALAAYEKNLPQNNKGAEKTRIAATPADLHEDKRTRTATPGAEARGAMNETIPARTATRAEAKD